MESYSLNSGDLPGQSSNLTDQPSDPMAQSTPQYETERPKATAHAHRQRQESTAEADTDTAPGPEPACRSRFVGHSVTEREWHEIPYTERLLSVYQPCSWPACYPDGPPDPTDVQNVVRSCHYASTFHRPHETGPAGDSSQNDDRPSGTCSVVRAIAGDSIDSIVELCEGDGVIWNGRAAPMLVVGATTDPSQAARLVGFQGGEYRVRERPEHAQPYAVYPGYGCQRELVRVEFDHDHPERS